MSFACSTIESRSQKHEDIDPCETATGKTEYLAFGPDKNIETQINLLSRITSYPSLGRHRACIAFHHGISRVT